MFDLIESVPPVPDYVLLISDPPSGLRAVLVIDDLTLGPAAGGIRTRRYSSLEGALEDALALARAMTLKCALGGLDAGGGKCVVLADALRDRARAFAALAERIDALGGLFRTAGDLGTTAADLTVMAEHTQYVHTREQALSDAVARGHEACLRACCQLAERELEGLRVAVQGCGAIGAAVARRLATLGVELLLADVDRPRADRLAAELSAQTAAPDEILTAGVDVVAPCAVGGVITPEVAARLRAWAVCGAANNILGGSTTGAAADAERVLAERAIFWVPDVISSAGAVIDGIGESVMGLDDRMPLVDGLGETARAVLEESQRTGRPPSQLAKERARRRIERAANRRGRGVV